MENQKRDYLFNPNTKELADQIKKDLEKLKVKNGDPKELVKAYHKAIKK